MQLPRPPTAQAQLVLLEQTWVPRAGTAHFGLGSPTPIISHDLGTGQSDLGKSTIQVFSSQVTR